MSFAEQSAREQAQLRRGLSDGTEGVCVAVDWENRLVTVNIGGGEQVMPTAGDTPWVGDRVTVAYLGRKPWCMGSTARSPLGVVASAPDAGKVVVDGDDDARYRYAYNAALSLNVGDVVALDHARKSVAYVLSSRPDEELPTVPTAPGGAVQERYFTAIDSANFRSGTYAGPEFEVSDNRMAAYWYGTQIRDTIPAGATILAAAVYLAQEWDQVPSTPSRLGLHGDGSNVGPPGLFGAIDISGGTQSVDLRGAFIDALRGGSAFGLGLYEGMGWRRFGAASSSGQIFVRWSS